jgi:hypothetical protein
MFSLTIFGSAREKALQRHYTVKKLFDISVLSRMSLTKLSLGRKNLYVTS